MNVKNSGSSTSRRYKNGRVVSNTIVGAGSGGHDVKGTTTSGPKTYKPTERTRTSKNPTRINSGGHYSKGTTASGPEHKSTRKNSAYGRGGHSAKSAYSGNETYSPKRRNLGERLEEGAKKIKMNKNVPSTRPDERTGRERANHKYIDKVRTKSGKIRYIYDIDTASGKQRNANDIHAANLKRRQQNARKNLQGTYKGQELRNKQTKFGNSPLGRIKGMADQAMKNVRSLPSKVMSAGSKFIKSLFR